MRSKEGGGKIGGRGGGCQKPANLKETPSTRRVGFAYAVNETVHISARSQLGKDCWPKLHSILLCCREVDYTYRHPEWRVRALAM